jgi:hypothetical protein
LKYVSYSTWIIAKKRRLINHACAFLLIIYLLSVANPQNENQQNIIFDFSYDTIMPTRYRQYSPYLGPLRASPILRGSFSEAALLCKNFKMR